MFDTLQAVFRGLILNPLLVAFARGIAEAAAFAAILTATELVVAGNLPDYLQPYGALIVLGLRQLEGVADKIDPAKQRRRDELREAANIANNVDDQLTVINYGDVRDLP